MTKPKNSAREFWIHKGTCNFCEELAWDGDFKAQNVRHRPDEFYDHVQTKDTIEGGIHVIGSGSGDGSGDGYGYGDCSPTIDVTKWSNAGAEVDLSNNHERE